MSSPWFDLALLLTKTGDLVHQGSSNQIGNQLEAYFALSEDRNDGRLTRRISLSRLEDVIGKISFVQQESRMSLSDVATRTCRRCPHEPQSRYINLDRQVRIEKNKNFDCQKIASRMQAWHSRCRDFQSGKNIVCVPKKKWIILSSTATLRLLKRQNKGNLPAVLAHACGGA